MTDLEPHKQGKYFAHVQYHDPALEAGGININQDDYTAELDRVYDVKSAKNMHIEIKNTGSSNGLVFRIEKASKSFESINSLTDADFEEVLPDTVVSATLKNIKDVEEISPESTAIRIRFKRETSGQDTTMGGIINLN